MQREMSILRQLAREGKITHHDASEMILAMDEVERRSVWEEGEFDPRRFIGHYGPSQTMLNDIIWLERSKCNKELKDGLRNLTSADSEELLERIEVLSPADPDQFAGNPLMENIDYLRRQNALEALSTLAALKHLEDFSGCEALESFDLNRSKEILRKSAQQKSVVEEFRISLPMRIGDTLRLDGQNSIEVYQAEGQGLEVIGEKVCWADTEAEARRMAEDIEIWTFLEGNRIWIRDSRIENILGWPMVNLKLFVPRGVAIANSQYSPTVAGFCHSMLVKNVEADISVNTAHSFSAENVLGNLRVDADSGDVTIINLDGKAEIESLCGDISVENSRADLEIRSVLGDVICSRLSGACSAKLIQGSLAMTDACTSHLDLSTKGGGIAFDGVVMGGMTYDVKSESGDIEVCLEDRSDCSLTAESEKGTVTCTLFEDEEEERRHRNGPNCIRIFLCRGTGTMYVVSKSGNIVIRIRERSSI